MELQPYVFWDEHILSSSLIVVRGFSMRFQGRVEILVELILC